LVETVQDWVTHTVELFHRRQAPDPLQVPSVPQDSMVCCVHWFRGSLPGATLTQAPEPLHTAQVPHSPSGSELARWRVQVPRDPATLQASQAPVQLVLQQYPSTQRPLEHSAAAEQVWPLAFFGTHEAPEQ